MTNVISKTSVSTIEELNNYIQNGILGNWNYSGATRHYRGQADAGYVLQTRIAEMFGDPYTVQLKSNQIFNSFRNKLRDANLFSEIFIAEMNQGLYEKLYYIIFQLQNIGIPTPFMDWSFDWRKALYFAIENSSLINKPGQLWVMLRPIYEHDHSFDYNPYYLENSLLINAAYNLHVDYEKFLGEKNRKNQSGEFFILPHDNCIESLETNKYLNGSLILIEIQPELKHQIYELRNKDVDDDVINLMQKLRLNFKEYNSKNVFGNMSDELKDIVNVVRSEFGFDLL